MKHPCKTAFTLLLSLFCFSFFSTIAVGATCKGLSQSKCTASSTCTWVKSYKTKTGKKVDAYCRAKSGKSSEKESKPSTKKSSSKNTEKKSSKKDSTKKSSSKKQ